MMYGVWIDDKNTLDTWGLALLAEVRTGEPQPKTNYISVPEADGDLDITGALTGGIVRYGMRDISFSLYPVRDIIAGKNRTATEQNAAKVRQQLAEFIHGQRRKLWLPDDPGHYFLGRLAIGDKGGYNDARIPVSMTAEPWRYKNTLTEIKITAAGTYIFNNETRNVIPEFTATAAGATVTIGSVTHSLAIGKNTFPDIMLEPGGNALTFSNVSGTITATYQEAVL